MSVWTNISATRLDTDSPVDEDLTTDIADNASSIRERQLRTGTHATGVRLALARGTKSDAIALDASGHGSETAVITFSADAVDGDPKFSVAPTCIGLAFEELSTGDDIGTPDSLSLRIEEGGASTTTVTVRVTVRAGTPNANVNFLFHWAFVGLVTAGE